jgi:hypothetical protein
MGYREFDDPAVVVFLDQFKNGFEIKIFFISSHRDMGFERAVFFFYSQFGQGGFGSSDGLAAIPIQKILRLPPLPNFPHPCRDTVKLSMLKGVPVNASSIREYFSGETSPINFSVMWVFSGFTQRIGVFIFLKGSRNFSMAAITPLSSLIPMKILME